MDTKHINEVKMSKYPCPKCLMAERENLKKQERETIVVDCVLSKVCNASPVAPHKSDPCCCGADWIPEKKFE